MRRAVLISAALHVAVFALAWFGLPRLFEQEPLVIVSAPVDVVVEQPARKPEPKPKPPPPKAQPKPPPPSAEKPPPPPPAPAIPEPPPMKVAEPPPPPPMKKPEPKPKEVAKPKPKPEPPVKVARVAPRPRAKPRPPPDRFQSLLKNLAKRKVEAPVPKRSAPTEAPVAKPDPVQTAMERRAIEQTLARMVRQQIAPCWNIPAGAKDAQEMKIGVRIRLGPDGSLLGAPRLIEDARLRTDPFYRAVAESAIRALLNPKCRPLKLPYPQYEIWKDITLNFDVGDALAP